MPFPARPARTPPRNSCDCHCHVFGPYDTFPLEAERSYTPPEASAQRYLGMLDQLGMQRGVLVQASAHGLDNAAMLHALAVDSDRLRGVAVVPANTSFHALKTLRDQGVRGLRLSRLLDGNGSARYRNVVDISALDALLPAMRQLDLHAQLWITLDQLPRLAPVIRTAGIPFVIDHMGRSEPINGVADPHFALMCELVAEGHLWVKLTPYRPSQRPPGYEDVRPLHEHLVRINPQRLLWGSDWPHINLAAPPDAGRLLDLFFDWTADARARQAILVDNPAALYGFPG
ncbi:amidohydrolase family protein [Bordetella genomosp. 13]|uniref:amidohydrolase family protein n=1 Tax=Bordetella genomosp. 13 TaxID=463040 RepID=UPI0016429927|nr:amidohydrolase family protein [Bordetella genomosp. 13]